MSRGRPGTRDTWGGRVGYGRPMTPSSSALRQRVRSANMAETGESSAPPHQTLERHVYLRLALANGYRDRPARLAVSLALEGASTSGLTVFSPDEPERHLGACAPI